MPFPFRLSIALKALRQLGLQPLALYGWYRLGLWVGHYQRVKRIENRGSESSELPSTPHSLFTLPPRDQLLRILGDDGKSALIHEADEIVAGEVRLFGGEPLPLQLTINAPLAHWTDYETGQAPFPTLVSRLSNLQPFDQAHGKPSTFDFKLLWEPARFGWAFTLGRAYHLSGDERYAGAFWRDTEQFLDSNPPYLGPHWMNGQEVAIRLMALVWADQVFAASSASTPERRARLAQSVAAHAARIPPTLIYARAQNNNHLVTEAAALFTAGCALPEHPAADRWRALGWKWLNRAFCRQIGSYGEYVQHSTNYHRLMLQCALWVDAILRTTGQIWPALTLESLARASHWLFSLLDPETGHAPNLGANDGAYIFPLTICPFADFRPVVQAAARAFLRCQLPGGVWDEMSLWLGLPSCDKTFEPGHYLSDNLHGRRSWAYLRASRFRSRLAHMDQLHFDLWWRGLNIAQDAGSYLYNGEPPWDNALVSTRVHNTVTVDGRDQMTRAGRFLTLDWFPAYSKSLIDLDEQVLQRMLAYHNGYHPLGVRHERTVTVYADGRWEVMDALLVKDGRAHTFRLHWLLPDWEWEIEKNEERVGLRLKSPHGWVVLVVSCQAGVVSLVRAGEALFGEQDVQPFEGWVSRTYGQKEPALSLAVEVKATQSMQFVTEFNFPTESNV